jgi:hypothetical protein
MMRRLIRTDGTVIDFTHPVPRLGAAWYGSLRPGRLGMADEDGSGTVRPGRQARRGEARHHRARRGAAWQGKARQARTFGKH